MRALLRQFSTPRGVPRHVSPLTPGSIRDAVVSQVSSRAVVRVINTDERLIIARDARQLVEEAGPVGRAPWLEERNR